MAKYIGKAMSISTFRIKQCKLAPIVTVYAHIILCAQTCAQNHSTCMQILNLSSLEEIERWDI